MMRPDAALTQQRGADENPVPRMEVAAVVQCEEGARFIGASSASSAGGAGGAEKVHLEEVETLVQREGLGLLGERRLVWGEEGEDRSAVEQHAGSSGAVQEEGELAREGDVDVSQHGDGECRWARRMNRILVDPQLVDEAAGVCGAGRVPLRGERSNGLRKGIGAGIDGKQRQRNG